MIDTARVYLPRPVYVYVERIRELGQVVSRDVVPPLRFDAQADTHDRLELLLTHHGFVGPLEALGDDIMFRNLMVHAGQYDYRRENSSSPAHSSISAMNSYPRSHFLLEGCWTFSSKLSLLSS